MTNEEILKKVIKKAYPKATKIEICKCCDDFEWWNNNVGYNISCIEELIFSHDFAKAFWGEEEIHNCDIDDLGAKINMKVKRTKVWQFHLSKMVLEEEPLKYIEKFL